MQQICVFPTVISVSSFPEAQVLNPIYERKALELHERERISKTQTIDRIHEMEEFAALIRFFETQIAARFTAFKFRDQPASITSCWANVQTRGDTLKYHTHSNSFLSGTYYVKAPRSCGNLEFLDPRATGYRFDIDTTEMNLYNAEAFSVAPREGMLILFPSSLMHGTGRNETDEPRISISFNVLPRGEIGHEARLTRATL